MRALAHAAIDISDGLVADLGHVASCSKARAVLELKRVPLSRPAAELARVEPSLIAELVTGGDDYELLFAAPAESQSALNEAARATGVPLTAVGRIEAGEGVSVLGLDGKPMTLERAGFRHF
jgi:thiamine-monophosphate kinase